MAKPCNAHWLTRKPRGFWPVHEWLKLLQDGQSQHDIALMVGLSQGHIGKLIRRAGLTPPRAPRRHGGGKPRKAYPVQRWLKMLERGMTQRELAARVGLSQPCISVLFRTRGLTPARSTRAARQPVERIAA